MRGMLVSWEGGGGLGAVPALGSHCLLEHREMAGLPFTFLHSELAPWVLCLEQCLLFTVHFFSTRTFKVIPSISLDFLSYGANVFPLTPV